MQQHSRITQRIGDTAMAIEQIDLALVCLFVVCDLAILGTQIAVERVGNCRTVLTTTPSFGITDAADVQRFAVHRAVDQRLARQCLLLIRQLTAAVDLGNNRVGITVGVLGAVAGNPLTQIRPQLLVGTELVLRVVVNQQLGVFISRAQDLDFTMDARQQARNDFIQALGIAPTEHRRLMHLGDIIHLHSAVRQARRSGGGQELTQTFQTSLPLAIARVEGFVHTVANGVDEMRAFHPQSTDAAVLGEELVRMTSAVLRQEVHRDAHQARDQLVLGVKARHVLEAFGHAHGVVRAGGQHIGHPCSVTHLTDHLLLDVVGKATEVILRATEHPLTGVLQELVANNLLIVLGERHLCHIRQRGVGGDRLQVGQQQCVALLLFLVQVSQCPQGAVLDFQLLLLEAVRDLALVLRQLFGRNPNRVELADGAAVTNLLETLAHFLALIGFLTLAYLVAGLLLEDALHQRTELLFATIALATLPTRLFFHHCVQLIAQAFRDLSVELGQYFSQRCFGRILGRFDLVPDAIV